MPMDTGIGRLGHRRGRLHPLLVSSDDDDVLVSSGIWLIDRKEPGNHNRLNRIHLE